MEECCLLHISQLCHIIYLSTFLQYFSATISIPAVAGSGESAGSLSPICVLSTIEMMTR